MSFHQSIIYAHRPWMSRRGSAPDTYLNEGHDPEHAQGMCLEAAVSIAKLLQTYQAHYGLRRINIQAVGITCSAALLLIFAVVINESEEKDTLTVNSDASSALSSANAALYLGICFNALDEFGYAWESAKKTKDFLTLLQKRWERQALRMRKGQSTIPSKRQRGIQDSDAEPQTRRRWSGTQFGQDNVLNSMDINDDLGWILMGSDASRSGEFRRGRANLNSLSQF